MEWGGRISVLNYPSLFPQYTLAQEPGNCDECVQKNKVAGMCCACRAPLVKASSTDPEAERHRSSFASREPAEGVDGCCGKGEEAVTNDMSERVDGTSRPDAEGDERGAPKITRKPETSFAGGIRLYRTCKVFRSTEISCTPSEEGT